MLSLWQVFSDLYAVESDTLVEVVFFSKLKNKNTSSENKYFFYWLHKNKKFMLLHNLVRQNFDKKSTSRWSNSLI